MVGEQRRVAGKFHQWKRNEREMKDKEVELLPLLQKVDGFANDVKLLIEKLKQMDKDIKELKQDILEIWKI